jgi:phasin protein
MSTTQKEKSSGKPRQRSRKADQRAQKAEAQERPKLDQQIEDHISSVMAEEAGDEAAAAKDAVSPVEAMIDEVAPAEVPLVDEIAPEDAPSPAAAAAPHCPIGVQAIATAYSDYGTRAWQESRSFFEKLTEVRSFDKAIALQTEYATRAYVDFVAESQKICQLYAELARQMLRPWERVTAR